MNMLHLADLHIGKILNGYSMLEDQRFVLDQVISIVEKHRVQAVLISGDIYDRSIPPKEALTLYNEFLVELLIKRNIPVLAIAGNHDSGERLEAGSELTEAMGYYLEGTLKKEIRRVTLHDEFGEVDFYLIAFADVSQVRLVFENEEIKTFDDAIRVITESISPREKVRSVVLSHCYAISQGKDGEEEKFDSQKPLSIGGKEFVRAEHFHKFDYAALGHLHRRQKCGEDKICYSGTLLKYSFSEEKHTKVAVLVHLGEGGSLEILEEPILPLHNIRTVRGRFEEIVEASLSDEHREDYIRFILEDEQMINEAMSSLKACYPNAMELRYEFREREMQKIVSHRGQGEKNLLEMTERFYRENYEENMREDMRLLVREIIDVTGGEE